MKLLLFALGCVFLTSFTTASTSVSNPSFLANDIRTRAQPTKITFGATVTTALAAGDTITCLAHYDSGIGVFTKPTGNTSSDLNVPITVESGAPGCSATAATYGANAAATTATHLTVVLADASGGTCAISGAFTMSISTNNIAPNSGAQRSMVQVSTNFIKDNTPLQSFVAYRLDSRDVCSNAVSKISVLPNDIRTGAQPTKITFGATVTTALAAGDTITCLAHYESGVGIYQHHIQTTRGHHFLLIE